MLQPFVYTYMEMKTRNGGKHLVLLLYLPKFPPNVFWASEIAINIAMRNPVSEIGEKPCLMSVVRNLSIFLVVRNPVSEIGHPCCDWSNEVFFGACWVPTIDMYVYTYIHGM